MLIPIPWVHTGLGLICVVAAIPLIARKVPMNRAYGFRLPQALLNEQHWYEINAYGGKWLLAFGLFLLGFEALTATSAPPPQSPLAPVYLIVPLLALVPVLGFVKAFARRMDRR